jgi:hypothetical protein
MKYAPVPYTPPPETEAEEAPAAPPPPQMAARQRASAPPPPPPRQDVPPVQGARAAYPPDHPLAGTPVAQKPIGGLSMGLLGGIAAALIAVIGVGGAMLWSGPGPAPTPPPQPQPQPPAQPRPQVVTIPPQPTPQGQPSATSAPPVVVSVPQTFTPQPQQPSTPETPVDPASAVGKLTILTPPAGSTCQAQVLEMNPRFVETVVDLGGGQSVLEIDSGSLCGLAIAGAGTVQARFAAGTVAGTVPSLSSAARIVFNPANTTGRLPDIAITGGSIEKIELRRK